MAWLNPMMVRLKKPGKLYITPSGYYPTQQRILMRKVLITSGGTKEYIDRVRVLTNTSSGKLGALIASHVGMMKDIQVYYVHAEGAVMPEAIGMFRLPEIKYYSVKTAQDAMYIMKKLVLEEKIDVVIHCMAVSDFTFKKSSDIKLKSNDPEAFIEYMHKTITLNPKIISQIKEWRPEITLIGFKFEVGIPNEELIALAKESIHKNKCDLVIANDKVEMNRMKEHVAYFVFSHEMSSKYDNHDERVFGKSNIASKIVHFLTSIL
jgi:phosphopantothenate--cysteine ligase